MLDIVTNIEHHQYERLFDGLFLCWCNIGVGTSLNPSPQGVEGAAAAAHALSLPAEAYGNDVSALHFFFFFFSFFLYEILIPAVLNTNGLIVCNLFKA